MKYRIFEILAIIMFAVVGCRPMDTDTSHATPMGDGHVCKDSCTKPGAIQFSSCCLERENLVCTKRGQLSSQNWYCGKCGLWCASESTSCQSAH